MENFLSFLSDNYLYFLIAAGVLFFALIGFVVDLKKKNKLEEEETNSVQETNTQSVETSAESNNIPAETVEPVIPTEVLNTITPETPEVSFNPAPPMPTVDNITPIEPTVDNTLPVNDGSSSEVQPQQLEIKPQTLILDKPGPDIIDEP